MIRFFLGAACGAAAVYAYALLLSYTRTEYTSGGVSIYVPALPPETNTTGTGATWTVH